MTKCFGCNVDKLSNEFPTVSLSSECDHSILQKCIRCCLKAIEKYGNYCPYNGCYATPDPVNLQIYKQEIDIIVYDYKHREKVAAAVPQIMQRIPVPINCSVTMLSGESVSLAMSSGDTVMDLKQKIKNKMTDTPPLREIRIMLSGKMLADNNTLSACGITNGSQLKALRIVFEVPQDLNQIKFSMSWGWPGRDPKNYLDTACITFSKRGSDFTHLDNIDFRSTWWQQEANFRDYRGKIRHNGNATIDHVRERNTSTLNVWVRELDNLRASGYPVTHCLFVLSAWRNGSMRGYQRPKLEFYDEYRPHVPLYDGNLEFSEFQAYSGVIVCLLTCIDSAWQIIRVGKPFSGGDARNYSPIVAKCREILRQLC